jgi:hypothetical protein
MYLRIPWELVADLLGFRGAHFGNNWSKLLLDAPIFSMGCAHKVSREHKNGSPRCT